LFSILDIPTSEDSESLLTRRGTLVRDVTPVESPNYFRRRDTVDAAGNVENVPDIERNQGRWWGLDGRWGAWKWEVRKIFYPNARAFLSIRTRRLRILKKGVLTSDFTGII